MFIWFSGCQWASPNGLALQFASGKALCPHLMCLGFKLTSMNNPSARRERPTNWKWKVRCSCRRLLATSSLRCRIQINSCAKLLSSEESRRWMDHERPPKANGRPISQCKFNPQAIAVISRVTVLHKCSGINSWLFTSSFGCDPFFIFSDHHKHTILTLVFNLFFHYYTVYRVKFNLHVTLWREVRPGGQMAGLKKSPRTAHCPLPTFLNFNEHRKIKSSSRAPSVWIGQ